MSENKFLKGAAVLGIAGIFTKVLGMFFRIPLTNWVGAEGLSYYGAVYPIYTFFLILSTAGIPVAISRMVSERIAVKNYGGAHKVFRTSVWLMGSIGMASFLIVYFGAGFIEKVVLKNPGTIYSLQAIAPSLLIVPIMAAYRGYFQGRQNMNPTAISQLIEQLFRVIVGLGLAYYLIKAGFPAVSAGAIFGGTAGAGVGLFVVILIYLMSYKTIKRYINRNKSHIEDEKSSDIVKKMLTIAVPITIGACILPLVNAIDAMLVLRRLQAAGWTLIESKLLWGRLAGYVSALVGMPQVLIQAIVMSLVPAIAASYKLNNHKEVEQNIGFAMRASMIIGFPCAMGMLALSKPILLLLYPRQVEEATGAVPTLMIMCISIIFLSTMQTLTGALQGIDKQMIPVKNLAIGALAKVVVTYILLGIKFININGAPIGTIVAYFVATVLNMRYIRRVAGVKLDMGLTFVRPFIASGIMGVAAWLMYKLSFMIIRSNALSTMAAIGVGAIMYGILIMYMGVITKDEIAKLPKGDKIVKAIGRFVK